MNLSARVVIAVLSMALIGSVWAESAPVYDADSLPPFEQGDDQGRVDLPPPPRSDDRLSDQESDGFVPLQSDQVNSAAASERNIAPSPTIARLPVNASVTERLRRLEQQIDNLLLPEKAGRLDSLQSQIQAMRSQLDQLSHQIQALQKAPKASVAVAPSETNEAVSPSSRDVHSKSMLNVESKVAKPKAVKAAVKPAAVSQEETSAESSQPNVQEEQQIYQTAYNLIKSKKYTEAITSLKGMLKKYPSGQFASNAHYWLGELYGLSGKNDQALVEFSVVVKDYTDSPRVAEAQLKVGLIYAAQSKWSDAKAALKKVVNNYPGTTSARLASEQLKQIKQVGH